MATLEYKTVDGSCCIHSHHVCNRLGCCQKYLRVKTKQEFLLSGVQWYTVTLDARKVVGHSVTGNVQEPSHTSKLHNFVQMQ